MYVHINIYIFHHNNDILPLKPKWDESLVVSSRALAKKWLEWDPSIPCTFNAKDVANFTGDQLQVRDDRKRQPNVFKFMRYES